MLKYSGGLMLLLLWLAAAGVPALAEGPDFRVEGVMNGLSEDPAELSAVIDGGIYAAGDRIGDYELAEVRLKEVVFKHLESGEAAVLPVGHQPEPEAEEPVPEETPVDKSWWENILEKYFPAFMNVRQKINHAGIVTDLKKVHVAAMVRVLESGESGISVSKLVAEGSLPPFMSRPRADGYHFRILPANNQMVRVYAEPVSGPAGKLHFMIDEHGYLYAEEGRRATQNSKQFNSGYSINLT